MDTIYELERKLVDLVAAASAGLPSARFSLRRFRENTAQTLSDMREDQRAHGLDEHEPFFSLTMFDANPVEPAIFLVPMFHADALRIAVGCGAPGDVIQLVDQFALADVEGMAAALRERGVSHILEIPRSLAEYWLANV